MANKSNPATQTISTPQGGGALHGIGETFSPDLHTGTGNFTVPIAMPPGRNGFQPQLSLIYSTVYDTCRLRKAGGRDLSMEVRCALLNFRVWLTPWQLMVESG